MVGEGSLVPGGVRIGVVGGEGQMGRWLRQFWEDQGYEVIFSDRATDLRNEDVVVNAAVTFVAVPLHLTPAVLRELLPHLSADRALVSIASLMGPSAQVLADAPGESLCAHPVFGPTVTATAGLPVILAPVQGRRWFSWLQDVLQQAGLSVRLSQPDEHDASMAVVQALLHSIYVALCSTIADAGLPAQTAMGWASPTFRLQLGLAARILEQDPMLYADLVVGNTLGPHHLEAMAAQLLDLAALARAGDRDGFAAAFLRARDSFGEQGATLAKRAEDALERFS